MNVKFSKKNILILSLVCAISTNFNKIIPLDINCEITEDEKCFGKYSNGRVFIGNRIYLSSLENLDLRNDVLVVDMRDGSDPNIKIINSYAVDNIKEMREIIKILLEYEKQYPSNWDRSEETMISEWIIHNVLYKLNYKLDHTTDVDFNNLDEDVYSFKLKK